MSSRNHYEKIEEEDYIIIDIDEFFKNFEEIQNTNGDKIFRNRETNEEFILIKYVKKNLEKENKHVKEFITSTIKEDIIDNPEYLSTYVKINEPTYVDKPNSPKDYQEQYSSQIYVPVTENFSQQGNLSQKKIQNIVSMRGILPDQSPPLHSVVSTQEIPYRQMPTSQQIYPQNQIYTFGQMPTSQQIYPQNPTYNTNMQRYSLQSKKNYVNLDNTVDTPDNDIPSKYSSRETRTLEYGEPIKINPISRPLHPTREFKKQRKNQLLSNMIMNHKIISNYNPIQLPQQHNISRSTLKNTPVDTRIIDQRVAAYEKSKTQPLFTENYINTDDRTISNNYHKQQIHGSPQINSQSGYPISQQLIHQPIEDALPMPIPLSGTISLPTIKTLTDPKDINCALLGNQLNSEMQNLGRPPIPGIEEPSRDMLNEIENIKKRCVVSGGNIRNKSKRFFYKLLNNPKTTYIKYKEHLYIKFKNYLLSVKKLQDYIYSKDYSKK